MQVASYMHADAVATASIDLGSEWLKIGLVKVCVCVWRGVLMCTQSLTKCARNDLEVQTVVYM